ncbi:hypothetical protein GCM10022262_31680 [Georgenia daeguensis]|uniref:CcmD family protein n=2 Tax=Georgenia daeguensis TaxID=908355 RepID=A0ABP8EYG4_9MICO
MGSPSDRLLACGEACRTGARVARLAPRAAGTRYVAGMDAVMMLVVWAVGLLVLYFVVRAAVKGGILDADQARARERGAGTSAEASTP